MSTDVDMAIQDTEPSNQHGEPIKYPHVVDAISWFLTYKVYAHDVKFQTCKNPKTQFTSNSPLKEPIHTYLHHLMQKIDTSPGVVVCMLIYIDRALEELTSQYQKQSQQDVPILMTSFVAQNLLLTAF